MLGGENLRPALQLVTIFTINSRDVRRCAHDLITDGVIAMELNQTVPIDCVNWMPEGRMLPQLIDDPRLFAMRTLYYDATPMQWLSTV